MFAKMWRWPSVEQGLVETSKAKTKGSRQGITGVDTGQAAEILAFVFYCWTMILGKLLRFWPRSSSVGQ